MVRRYTFDLGTFLFSLRINEFFSLPDVGSNYLSVVAWCGQLAALPVLISSTQQFVFQSCDFFVMEGDYSCLAICTVVRLTSFCLVTEVTSVRLEWNFLCFRVLTVGLCESYELPLIDAVSYCLVVASVLHRVQFRSVQQVQFCQMKNLSQNASGH